MKRSMTSPFGSRNRVLSRRTLLRGAGVCISLPFLDAMSPAFALAADTAPPRRMVLINKTLGLYGPDFFPQATGRDYDLTPYLQELAEFRADFTVFSGLSHPDAGSAHNTETSFLTSAPHAGSASFRNTVSLDQVAADYVGAQTRYPAIVLSSHVNGLSVTRNGVQVPPDKDPAAVFRRLFVTGTPAEILAQEQQLRDGHSILDTVRSETTALQRRVGPRDRERLDQYFSAVREVEGRLNNAEAWSRRPKPRIQASPPGPYPESSDVIGRTRMMLDLVHLAVQTDSSRLVTFAIDSATIGVPPIPGVKETCHNCSHHGQNPEKIEQLRRVERAELQVLHDFVAKLKGSNEASESLLDQTMVLYGSNLGNASSHDPRNLPIALFGGGFKHGQHLAFDQVNNTPLANLFVSMLQRFGLEVDMFGTSTGSLSGLEIA